MTSALRRAANLCDGWYGLEHSPASAAARVAQLRELRARAGRERERFQVTVGGRVETPDDVKRYAEAGVDRLVVTPWRRSREALDAMRHFAEVAFG